MREALLMCMFAAPRPGCVSDCSAPRRHHAQCFSGSSDAGLEDWRISASACMRAGLHVKMSLVAAKPSLGTHYTKHASNMVFLFACYYHVQSTLGEDLPDDMRGKLDKKLAPPNNHEWRKIR